MELPADTMRDPGGIRDPRWLFHALQNRVRSSEAGAGSRNPPAQDGTRTVGVRRGKCIDLSVDRELQIRGRCSIPSGYPAKATASRSLPQTWGTRALSQSAMRFNAA